MASINYRHELKYRITTGDYLIIRNRLDKVMTHDPHVGDDGCYRIQSIYFDNFDDKALREKENGNPQREKFRIRFYNGDLDNISLEKKIKHNSLCMKADAPITENECRKILSGDTSWMMDNKAPLIEEFYCKMQYQQLRPKVLVSYTREPFVYAAGNVRVTSDFDIRTSLLSKDFLCDDIVNISAEGDPGTMILEIKYDAFLPDVIRDVLQTGWLRQDSFSKYGACRCFG